MPAGIDCDVGTDFGAGAAEESEVDVSGSVRGELGDERVEAAGVLRGIGG